MVAGFAANTKSLIMFTLVPCSVLQCVGVEVAACLLVLVLSSTCSLLVVIQHQPPGSAQFICFCGSAPTKEGQHLQQLGAGFKLALFGKLIA